MERKHPITAPSPYVLWVVVLTGIAAISVASILIRLAEAPPLSIAAYRVTLASLAITPFFALKSRATRHQWNIRVAGITALSGFFLAFHFIFWISSLKMTSVASSVILVSTNPLFVGLISFFWFRERSHWTLWAGVFCTIVGSSIVAGSDFSFSKEALRGDLLALLGALMASGYLLAGRVARRSLDLLSYSFGAYGAASLVLLTGCFATSTPLTGFAGQTYGVLALLALVPQLIGHTAFNWTLGFLSPTIVAILILGEPIGATVLAFFFFEESPGLLKGAGLLILGTGIVLGSLSSPKSGDRNDFDA
jgi:drug/metabolite transporter (DMT)-like permease